MNDSFDFSDYPLSIQLRLTSDSTQIVASADELVAELRCHANLTVPTTGREPTTDDLILGIAHTVLDLNGVAEDLTKAQKSSAILVLIDWLITLVSDDESESQRVRNALAQALEWTSFKHLFISKFAHNEIDNRRWEQKIHGDSYEDIYTHKIINKSINENIIDLGNIKNSKNDYIFYSKRNSRKHELLSPWR